MTKPLTERRGDFIRHLYDLEKGRSSVNRRRAATCRRDLAVLRRGLSGDQQLLKTCQIVIPRDPPQAETDTWLLVAGLFALHPRPWPGGRPARSLGSSAAVVAELRGESVAKRFHQLLVRDPVLLPRRLQHFVRLLASHDVPVDYEQLLADLVVVLAPDRFDQDAHRVRLRWARDFHLPSTLQEKP